MASHYKYSGGVIVNITSYLTGVATVIVIFLLAYLMSWYSNKRNYPKCPREDENCGNINMCRHIYRRDIIYISIMLIFITIIALTKALYSNENFASQLSFAGMVSSIILSVLAIIVTLFGETKNQVAKDILTQSANTIEKTTEQLKAYTENIDTTSLSRLEDNIGKINSMLEEAIERLGRVERNSEKAARLVGTNKPDNIVVESKLAQIPEKDMEIEKKFGNGGKNNAQ